jgi:opacity protein-like surface antigen
MIKQSIPLTAVLLLTTLFAGFAQQDHSRSPFNLELRTNLLYDAALTPTLGVEWHIHNDWGIKVDGGFSHWGGKHGMVHNIWIVNPEVRWYMGNMNRYYIGFGGNVGRYDIYKGIIGNFFFPEEPGYQGGLYSGGVSAGYKLALNGKFLLDLNIGLGYTRFKYDVFTVTDHIRVYQEIKEKDVIRNFWGPTQAGISLVWKLGDKR